MGKQPLPDVPHREVVACPFLFNLKSKNQYP